MIIYYIIPTINTHKRKKELTLYRDVFRFSRFRLHVIIGFTSVRSSKMTLNHREGQSGHPCTVRQDFSRWAVQENSPPGDGWWWKTIRLTENWGIPRAFLPRFRWGLCQDDVRRWICRLKGCLKKMKCWFKLYIFIRYSVLHHVHSILLPGSV